MLRELSAALSAVVALTVVAASSFAATETPLTIEQLLAQGWEIAGYASGYDNRTSLILFRHPGVNALVQYGILYDGRALSAQSSIATSSDRARAWPAVDKRMHPHAP